MMCIVVLLGVTGLVYRGGRGVGGWFSRVASEMPVWSLTKLSRKHGFKITPGFPCSVEDCSLAVAEVVVTAEFNLRLG